MYYGHVQCDQKRCLHLQRHQKWASGEDENCVADLMGTFEYLKSLVSWNTAFSQRFVEWMQLELAALLKQENLLRIYKT